MIRNVIALILLFSASAFGAQFKGLNIAILNSSIPVASGGGGGGGGSFANDNFTGAADLASHTSDSGHSWTTPTAGSFAINASNRVHCNNNSDFFRAYMSAVPASADYYVEMDITVGASGNVSIGPAARVSTTQNTCYFVRWNDGSWELYKNVNGSVTSIGTNYAGDIPTTTKTCRLQVTGTSITVYINGVSRITATDGDISDAGRPGLASYYADDDDGVARYADVLVAGT